MPHGEDADFQREYNDYDIHPSIHSYKRVDICGLLYDVLGTNATASSSTSSVQMCDAPRQTRLSFPSYRTERRWLNARLWCLLSCIASQWDRIIPTRDRHLQVPSEDDQPAALDLARREEMSTSSDASTINWDALCYQSGFGNTFTSEAKPGALPEVRLYSRCDLLFSRSFVRSRVRSLSITHMYVCIC